VRLFHNITELLTLAPEEHPADDPAEAGLGVVRGGAVLCGEDGRVQWSGPEGRLPGEHATGTERVDLGGAVVLPGLVDAHTHLVFAGDRTRDFADRCAGESYEAIAARGGGIRLTVRATRAASLDALAALARPRLLSLLAHGVTTVEVKSGYGLSVADELKMLEVVARLGREGPWRLVPTVLGAHIVPDAFKADRAGYVRLVTEELLPEVARRGLARHVDVFCDAGAFTLDEALRVLEGGRALGFGLKVHAEQLTRTGAAAAAAGLGAVSADHLEHLSEADADALAAAGTVGVLLPGAALFLGGHDRAPARRLLDRGVAVALATDCNPGTCPSTHLPLMTTLGCAWLGMAPREAVAAVTRSAAWAVGARDGTGTLGLGAPCDLAVCDVESWRHVPYLLGHNPVTSVWVSGRKVLSRPPLAGLRAAQS
jgi:imidazolonepropionase